MIGFPNETIGQIWDTINLAREIVLDWYGIQIVIFLSNAAMGKEMLQKGLLTEQSIVDAQFFAGSLGKQQSRERSEDRIVPEFRGMDILRRSKDYVPTEDELKDIWLVVDYLVNYERILPETNPVKLQLKLLFLQDVCKRKTVRNPLSTMFLGIIEVKLGLMDQAQAHFRDAHVFMERSAFWKTRCISLGLDKTLEDWEVKSVTSYPGLLEAEHAPTRGPGIAN